MFLRDNYAHATLFTALTVLALLPLPERVSARTSSVPPVSAFQSALTSDEETALRDLADRYYSVYPGKDAAKLLALFSAKSPFLASHRPIMERFFQQNITFTYRGVTVKKRTKEDNLVRLRLVVQLEATDTATGKPFPAFGKVNRILRCVREDEGWKVWFEGAAEDELIENLLSSAEKDREALLASETELVTPGLCYRLLDAGNALKRRDKLSAAMEAFRLALRVAERIGFMHGIGYAWNNIGTAYSAQNQFDEAIACYEKGRALFERLDDARGLSYALNGIGTIFMQQANYPKALETFETALRGASDDKQSKAQLLHNIGVIHCVQGNYAKGFECHTLSLTCSEQAGDEMGVANALENIGNLYARQCDYSRALDYLERSRRQYEKIGARLRASDALDAIGMLHSDQGNYELALELYRRSLTVREVLGDKRGIAESNLHIGSAQFLLDHFEEALTCFNTSLAQFRQIQYSDLAQADILNDIGNVHLARGEYDTARKTYLQSLALLKARHPLSRTATLCNLARAYFALGDTTRAMETASESAQIAAETGLPDSLWRSYELLGRACLRLGQSKEGRTALEKSVTIIESLRHRVVGRAQDRQRFLSDRATPYYECVSLLVGQQEDWLALNYAERAKARVLLDVMQGGRVDIVKAMTAEEQAEENRLNTQLVSLNTQIHQEQQKDKPNQALLRLLGAHRQQLRFDYDAFQTSLYNAHPYLKAQRGEFQVFGTTDALRLLTDTKTVLLEYMVGEKETHLFVLTRDDVKSDAGTTLPQVGLRVYVIPIGRKALGARVEEFRRRISDPNQEVPEAARSLYDLLLLPAKETLRDRTTLCIVPDESLWNLPFQALQSRPGHYLLEDYALFCAPSLTVLGEMTKLRELRSLPGNASAKEVMPGTIAAGNETKLLAVGNPFLGRTGQMIARTRRDDILLPLPEAETEARTVAQVYGKGSSQVFLGAEAREDRIKQEMTRCRILHFATHAILDNTSPMYSHIVLAQPDLAAKPSVVPASTAMARRGGNRRDNAPSRSLWQETEAVSSLPAETDGSLLKEDGMLEAREIITLSLNADLVVLSACETARGQFSAGEGVIGLSWAFFVAGCPTTVVSQWEVDSSSTTRLMIGFHRALNRNANGTEGQMRHLSVAAALRDASLRLLNGEKEQFRHPFYWAGFSAFGDAR